MHKKISLTVIVLFVCIIMVIPPVFSNSYPSYSDDKREIRNVIVLVPDGCSLSIQTVARWYKGGELNLDSIQRGSISTWAADSVITDSASAATAIATGHKTDDKFISVGPKSTPVLTGFTPTAEPYVPLATVLEGAKLDGKATGLVATSTVSHATPAGFAAHTPYRDQETEITKQLVYQGIDVVFGGGFQNLINKTETYTTSFGAKWKGARDDIRAAGDNLYKTLLDRGYQFVDSRNGMLSLSSGKAWGLFANGFMQADINRQYMGATQPSIAEMTAKAIELLSKDKDGFFLVVEGSQVDWGDHYCDVAWSVGDFLAFDNAVGVALDFAQKDGKTLVMAFPDHNTGGLTIGNYYEATNKIGHEYTATTLEDVANPLKGMKITAAALTAILTGVTDNTDIKAIFKEWWNLDITDTDISAMKTGSTINNFTKIGEYIDKTYTVFGWTTAGHTGDDVPLWAYGPMHNTPVGHYDNTDFAKIIAEILDFKLIETQNKLFVKVSDVFKSSEWALDLTDSKNPVLEINYGGVAATLPASEDILKLRWNGESTTYMLEGLVIYCPDIMNVFIPIEAINLIISAG